MSAGRLALQRLTPSGELRSWPDPMDRREAGRCVAYCLHDNGAATRAEATAAGMATEAAPVGEWIAAHGYRFRLVDPAAVPSWSEDVAQLDACPNVTCAQGVTAWRSAGIVRPHPRRSWDGITTGGLSPASGRPVELPAVELADPAPAETYGTTPGAAWPPQASRYRV